ncbi:uncharacterized protein DS421_15g516900 [Arachis hypogaea]|nr:uncharacterized protein DS421_15g516900 [Arachis hypogaea]
MEAASPPICMTTTLLVCVRVHHHSSPRFTATASSRLCSDPSRCVVMSGLSPFELGCSPQLELCFLFVSSPSSRLRNNHQSTESFSSTKSSSENGREFST